MDSFLLEVVEIFIRLFLFMQQVVEILIRLFLFTPKESTVFFSCLTERPLSESNTSIFLRLRVPARLPRGFIFCLYTFRLLVDTADFRIEL